jgi:tellurite resistance protein TerC
VNLALSEPQIEVSATVWLGTVGVLVAVIALDLIISDRKPHVPTLREATAWSLVYIGAALVFALGLYAFVGGQTTAEFLGGYVTEKALSVDNLFVFVIIMAAFAVPPEFQHRVLMFGIILALILRGIFIALGAAAISRFSEVFYVFGAFLIYTAVQLARHRGEQPDLEKNKVIQFAERRLSTTRDYDGPKLRTVVGGRRMLTPMVIVLVAIGTTDVLFALDSIPAIFGITQEPYLVFTANAFALLGLRQLYFLVNGLLDRIVYLSIGLAMILGFIGIKLFLHALHENGIDFGHIGEGPWTVLPEIGIGTSLVFIGLTLLVTTVASLVKVRRDPSARKPVGVLPDAGALRQDVREDQRR